MTVEFGPYRATSSRESCLVFPPVSSYLPSSCDGTRRIDLLEGPVTGRETRLDVGHVELSVDEQKELVSGEPTAIQEEPGVAAWKREKRKVDQPVGRRNIQMWIWRIVSSSRPSFIFCLSRWLLRLLPRCNGACGFCQFLVSPFLQPSPFLRASTISIEKPPVSYYSPAVCHCERRTKRHEADPCLTRPRYSAISE